MFAAFFAKAAIRPVLAKVLGFSALALVVALVGASTFGWVQTERLSAAKETIAARDSQIETLGQRIKDDDRKLADRDRLIGLQNEAVLAISKASEENRAAYQARIAKADTVARSYQAQAADIMSKSIETEDELERSRAALKLIEDTLSQEN